MPFYYTPWLLFLFRRAEREPRLGAAVALLLWLVLLEGGAYPFAFFLILLAVDAAARLTRLRRARRVVRSLRVAVPLTLALGAMRLVPILETLLLHPRHTHEVDRLSPRELLEMLTAREHGWTFAGHPFVWPEYGAYVGWAALLLAGLGAVVALRRRRAFVVAGALVFGALLLGDVAPFFPWPLLHRLPIFDSLRVPSRFVAFFLFYSSLLAAYGVDALERRARSPQLSPPWRRAWLATLALALVGVAADLLVTTRPITDRWDGPPIASEPASDHLVLLDPLGYGREYASYPRRNVGSAECNEPLDWNVSPALAIGDVPQATIDAGVVESEGRGIDHVWARVRTDRAARLVFNQNLAPGWSSREGAVEDDHGRLAVRLAGPFEGVVEARYLPTSALVTPPIALLALLISIALLGRSQGRKYVSRSKA